MRGVTFAVASAALAAAAAAPSGDTMPWAGAAMVLAVGVAAATTGVGVAVRRRRQETAPFRGRATRSTEIPVPPDVAAALERRTLRRGRLRLTDEAGGSYPDSHGNASD